MFALVNIQFAGLTTRSTGCSNLIEFINYRLRLPSSSLASLIYVVLVYIVIIAMEDEFVIYRHLWDVRCWLWDGIKCVVVISTESACTASARALLQRP